MYLRISGYRENSLYHINIFICLFYVYTKHAKQCRKSDYLSFDSNLKSTRWLVDSRDKRTTAAFLTQMTNNQEKFFHGKKNHEDTKTNHLVKCVTFHVSTLLRKVIIKFFFKSPWTSLYFRRETIQSNKWLNSSERVTWRSAHQ